MNNTITLTSFLLLSFLSLAQEPAADIAVTDSSETTDYVEEEEDHSMLSGSFVATRIINGHSTQTLSKGTLEFRVEHRFGDIAGSNGGVQQWFGIDNSSDIRIAFEYGITDNLMIGIGRSKGAGNPYRSLLDGLVKWKFVEQKKGGFPLSLAVLGTTSYTYMKKSQNIYDVAYFPKEAHRFAYSTQLNISRQLIPRISVSLMPTMVYRNYVAANDVNALFAIGGAAKIGITKQMGFIVEYYQGIHDQNVRTTNTNSLGVAMEFITFGHSFTLNFTNSRGFGETQFIPYTFENWLKGQFRFGFSITRKF